MLPGAAFFFLHDLQRCEDDGGWWWWRDSLVTQIFATNVKISKNNLCN